jgi:DNA topoisomerase-1
VEEGSKEDEQEFTPRTLRCSKCSFRQELSTLEDALQQSQIYADRPAPECPECGSAMEVKRGRKGLFLGCSNYPDCKETSNIPDADVPDPVPTYERCDKCESIMVLRWGRYGQFLGCSRFPRCRNIWRLSTGKKKECPREDCDGRLIKKIDQDENEYFGCSRYPKSDFKTEELPDKKAGSKK